MTARREAAPPGGYGSPSPAAPLDIADAVSYFSDAGRIAAALPGFDVKAGSAAWRDAMAAVRHAAASDTGRLSAVAAEAADGQVSLAITAALAALIAECCGVWLEVPDDSDARPAAEAARLVDAYRRAARGYAVAQRDVSAAVPDPRTAFAFTALLAATIMQCAGIPLAALDDIEREGAGFLQDVDRAAVASAAGGGA